MKELFKNFWGSKTFAFLALVFTVSTVLLVFGKLTAEMWVNLVEWVSGAGAVRGVTEQVTGRIQTKKNEIDNTLASASDDDLARAVVDRTDKP